MRLTVWFTQKTAPRLTVSTPTLQVDVTAIASQGLRQLIAVISTEWAEASQLSERVNVLEVGNLDQSLQAPLAVSLGAIPGALSRYYLTVLFAQWLGTDFPYGTFVINLSGSLLMGFFTTLAIEQIVTAPALQLLITTGFLGSYTTFSTYILDTANLLRTGNRVLALVYWAGSVVLGGLCLEVGIIVARTLR